MRIDPFGGLSHAHSQIPNTKNRKVGLGVYGRMSARIKALLLGFLLETLLFVELEQPCGHGSVQSAYFKPDNSILYG
jgi:hypothetical protein